MFMGRMRIIGCLLLLVGALASCGGDGGNVSNEAEYLQYISEFTAGTVSKHSSVIVKLANPSPKFASSDKESAVKGIFEFSPKVKGEAHWLDQYTIEFKPSKPLESGQEYIATFHLSEVQSVSDEKNNDFVFPFSVVKQNISLNMGVPIYKEDGTVEVEGSLFLADRESKEDLGKLLTATMEGKPCSVEWGHIAPRAGGCQAHFKVGDLKAGSSAKTLKVAYDGKPIGCDSAGEEPVLIPQGKTLEIVSHKVVSGEDAHVEVYFNQALPAQNFKSKVYFSDGTPCNISQEYSFVRVYPSTLFSDTRTLTVDKSLEGRNGSILGATVTFDIKFESIKPEVAFPNNGSVLPTTNGAVLPFRAVNLKSVDVTVLKIKQENVFQHLQINELGGKRELKRVAKPILSKTINLEETGLDLTQWQTYFMDLKELVNEDPYAVYNVILSFKKSYSNYPCSKEVAEDDDEDFDYSGVKAEWGGDPDNYGYYYGGEYYNSYNEDDEYIGDDPCYNVYYKQSYRRKSTNILVTDLGVIAKLGTNNKVHVIVTNLKTAQVESGANVKFYSYQLDLLGEATTNEDGFAEFTYAKEKPIFVEVEKNGQVNYLKINDASALSLSSFDVAGATYEKGMKGFVYGERGVWRPGDTLNISLMLQDQERMIPDNHPIVMSLLTPRGKKYAGAVQKYRAGASIYCFRIPTEMEVPTGLWNISFKVGGATFTKSLHIETVKPNRLKVKLETKDNLLRGGVASNFHLYSEWLHGGKAAGMKADVSVKMKRAVTAFPSFSDYTFESPAANEYKDAGRMVYEGRTDGNGDIYFNMQLPEIEGAPGLLEANFSTRVHEGEGDFSTMTTTSKFSPYRSYVGIKAPEAPNQRGIYYTGTTNTFKVVLVDEEGRKVNSSDWLKYEVFKLSWRWWWDSRSDDNLAYYVNNTCASAFKSGGVQLNNGSGSFSLNISDDDWGRYLILVKDGDDHVTGCTALFDWESCVGKSKKGDPAGATMLTFTTDKGTYNVGEKVKINIPASAGSRALLSIENRSRVISSQWVEPNGKDGVAVEITATPEMVPNAYVNITLIQPHKTTENDLPIRLYGVQNINVQDEATILTPRIEMADEVASGKPFEVKVAEANNQEMDYTLAIVDEGLLDITNFQTPNAHDHFFKREALGVNTWDVYDQVIGAFGGRIDKLFGIGGDNALKAQEEQAQKRFKSIVKFVGPCRLGAGKKASHTIDLPNYYGSVRVMVVAGNGKAYGNAEKAVKVTSPLMVLATLPRVAGPNEDLSLPVNVFNNTVKEKNVKITVTAGDLIKVVDQTTKEASIEKEGDKITTFKLKVGNQTGKQKIVIKATDGPNDVSTEVWLEVRNPNQPLTNVQSAAIEPGKSTVFEYVDLGQPGSNKAVLEVGGIPSLNIANRMDYLIGYPHGCAEQTTSKGYPQLLLPSLCELSRGEADDCEANVRNTIKKLEQMQMADGSVSYWMGCDYTYDWVNNYVGDFMIAAQSRGYDVSSFLSSWCSYQSRKASEWKRNTKSYRDDAVQAYRLFTLAAYGKPAKGAMNRLKEDKALSLRAKWRLAGAYALIGDKKTAEKIVDGVVATQSSDYDEHDYETFGSQLRDEAMVMEVMVLLGRNTEAFKLAQSIAKVMSSNRWLSTQETAYALIAMSKLANDGKSGAGVQGAYSLSGASGEIPLKTSGKGMLKVSLEETAGAPVKVTLRNNGSGTMFVSLSQSGIPLEDLSPAKAEGVSLQVDYYGSDGSPVDVANLKQGADFTAKVSVRNMSSYEDYKELSLTQVFPSGWEIINDRLNDDAAERGEQFSYRDVRDDRVMTYFNLKRGERKTFTVSLHAAYAGRFFMPAVTCEYMYDVSVSAKTKGQWVTVVK